jgi:hypothetical protein
MSNHRGGLEIGPAGVPGRDRPLRGSDVDSAVSFVRERESQNRGGVYFLVGSGLAGGARVLDGIDAVLGEDPADRRVARGSLAAGTFQPTRPVKRRSLIDRSEDMAKLVKTFASIFLIPPPVQELIAVLIETSAAALRLVQDETQRVTHTNADPIRPLLAAAAAERPLVVLIYGMDSAYTAWFWQLLSDEWAPDVGTDLRGVLVVALEGPVHPPPSETGLPPGLRAATRLRTAGLAEWRGLEPIAREDVAGWLGPAHGSVISQLWTASGESPDLVECTWADWMRAHAVELDPKGNVRFLPDADARGLLWICGAWRLRGFDPWSPKPRMCPSIHCSRLSSGRCRGRSLARTPWPRCSAWTTMTR